MKKSIELVVVLGLALAGLFSVSSAAGAAAPVASVSAPQQDVTVTGRVVDAATGEGEPYVTYSIASVDAPADAAPLKMTITAEDGSFSETLPAGDYIIKFSSLGKRDLEMSVTAPADLGTITMEDDEEVLKSASITAMKPLVKMEVDKMTYKVEDDVDSKTMTMLDMLRKVPMVTVDAQDNITVNGSSSFKVYVDGKPNAMLSSNPSQIFKMMPASAFKSVEVITNPGAKYDAEGVGGVLNLITDKASGQQAIQDGYNASVRLEGSTRGDIGGGAFVTGQKGKFSFSANLNLMHQDADGMSIETYRQQLGTDGTVLSDMTSSGTSHQKGRGVFGDFSASYEIDSLRLVTATLGIMDDVVDETGATTTTLTPGGTYNTDTDQQYLWASYRGGIDYQRSFADKEGKALTVSYLFSARPDGNDTYTRYGGYAPDRHSDVSQRMVEQTGQIDFTTPFAEGQTLSTGAKFISRNNSSDSFYYLDDGTGTFVPADGSLQYRHLNSILGAYAEWGISREKWSAKAGTRYEHTFQQVRYESGAGTDFSLNYGNVVPSASVQYNIGALSNIGLSYNLRISRPGIGYLNPYVNRSDVLSISYGNTNLQTEKSHNVNLVYNFFTPVVMLNLTARYSYCGNAINEYSFFDADGVLNTTYGNIVQRRGAGVNAFVNVNIGQKTRIYSNLGADYAYLVSEARGLSNSGWGFNMFTGLQQVLPWDLRLSANVFVNTPGVQLDGSSSGFAAMMGGLNKSFLEDRLSVGLTGMMGFYKHGALHMEQHTAGSDYRSGYSVDVPVARVGLSVTYKFGNSQNVSVKKTKRSISNDDVMEKGSGATQTDISSGN